jgi:hypothetical protein
MSEKSIAVVQSNYLPWIGYFDLIASVDEFVLYDDMQFTKRDWRNRNKIKTPDGEIWLTVPVDTKGKYFQKINQTKIQGTKWQAEHWKSFQANYKRAPFFSEITELIFEVYNSRTWWRLSDLNRTLIEIFLEYLEIDTAVSDSSKYELVGNRSEKLAHLCKQANATTYVSGPSARDYLLESHFAERQIEVKWFEYVCFPEYPQQWGTFKSNLSIIDVLMNNGKATKGLLSNAS